MTRPDAATRLSAAYDWLLGDQGIPTALATIPAERRPDLTEAWPGDKVARTTVILDGAAVDQVEKSLGRRSRAETITAELYIAAVKPGGTATEARRAVQEVADAISARFNLATGLAIGGTACWCLFRVTGFAHGLQDKSRSALLRCELTISESRLT